MPAIADTDPGRSWGEQGALRRALDALCAAIAGRWRSSAAGGATRRPRRPRSLADLPDHLLRDIGLARGPLGRVGPAVPFPTHDKE